MEVLRYMISDAAKKIDVEPHVYGTGKKSLR